MSDKKAAPRYSEALKKDIVELYQSGKTYVEIQREYGVSSSSLAGWIRKYARPQWEEGEALTDRQIKALKRRNAELEEENAILKKAAAIFALHSDRD